MVSKSKASVFEDLPSLAKYSKADLMILYRNFRAVFFTENVCLTEKEAQEMLKVSRLGLRECEYAGLQVMLFPDGSRRYKFGDVYKWMDERKACRKIRHHIT